MNADKIPEGAASVTAIVAAVVAMACGSGTPPGETEGGDVPATAVTVTGSGIVRSEGVPAVVVLEPTGASATTSGADTALMDQLGLEFHPAFLTVRPGQPVEFRNSEDVAHNVRMENVASGATLFNVATMRGDPYYHVFEETGGYSVTCDIHPGMTAFVFVDAAPYAAPVEEGGGFTLSEVTPGSYTLRVWTPDSVHRFARGIEVGGEPVALATDSLR